MDVWASRGYASWGPTRRWLWYWGRKLKHHLLWVLWRRCAECGKLDRVLGHDLPGHDNCIPF